jgi:nucleoside-diphosphate-sugar epimerase
MTVLVTGAASFIGNHLIRVLVNENCDIYATYRHSLAAAQLNEPCNGGIHFIQLDLSKHLDFERLPAQVDIIIHLAAISNYQGISNAAIADSNIIGTNNILTYAKAAGAKKIVYASSVSVHGKASVNSISFDTPIFEPNYYGLSKYAGEIALASHGSDFASISIRLPGVLGSSLSRSLIPAICNRLLKGGAIEVYNPQSLFNNAVHINELSLFIKDVMFNEWSGVHAFPLAAKNPVTFLNLVELMKKQLGSASKISVSSAQKKSFTLNSEYATEYFNYCPADISEICLRHCNELLN